MRSSKLAVITGGGTGIGRALVIELVKRDYNILVIGRRKEPLEELYQKFPDNVEYLCADVSIKANRNAIADKVGKREINFLVHNAAVVEPFNDLMLISEEAFQKIMVVNVFAPIFLTKRLLPNLKEGSRILHISSIAAHKSVPGLSAYCASKAALYNIYLSLKRELGVSGIYVGSADPGVVDTDMQLDVRLNEKFKVNFSMFHQPSEKNH